MGREQRGHCPTVWRRGQETTLPPCGPGGPLLRCTVAIPPRSRPRSAGRSAWWTGTACGTRRGACWPRPRCMRGSRTPWWPHRRALRTVSPGSGPARPAAPGGGGSGRCLRPRPPPCPQRLWRRMWAAKRRSRSFHEQIRGRRCRTRPRHRWSGRGPATDDTARLQTAGDPCERVGRGPAPRSPPSVSLHPVCRAVHARWTATGAQSRASATSAAEGSHRRSTPLLRPLRPMQRITWLHQVPVAAGMAAMAAIRGPLLLRPPRTPTSGTICSRRQGTHRASGGVVGGRRPAVWPRAWSPWSGRRRLLRVPPSPCSKALPSASPSLASASSGGARGCSPGCAGGSPSTPHTALKAPAVAWRRRRRPLSRCRGLARERRLLPRLRAAQHGGASGGDDAPDARPLSARAALHSAGHRRRSKGTSTQAPRRSSLSSWRRCRGCPRPCAACAARSSSPPAPSGMQRRWPLSRAPGQRGSGAAPRRSVACGPRGLLAAPAADVRPRPRVPATLLACAAQPCGRGHTAPTRAPPSRRQRLRRGQTRSTHTVCSTGLSRQRTNGQRRTLLRTPLFAAAALPSASLPLPRGWGWGAASSRGRGRWWLRGWRRSG